jgi:cell division protein FtsZ
MGDEVRVTVIAAGFERWEEVGRPPSSPSLKPDKRGGGLGLGPAAPVDIFAEDADDELDLGDDDFDVPSFLR